MLARKRHKTRWPGISYRLVDDNQPDGARRYVVGYSDVNGQWHTETLPLGSTLEDAKNRRGELQTRKVQGETLIPTKKTVSDLLDEWIEGRRDIVEPKTLEVYTWAVETHLKPNVGRIPIRRLAASDLVALRKKWVRQGLKKWSIAKIETPLRNALTVAARDGLIPASPFTKILAHERVKNDQKEMRCLERVEIQKLLASASTSKWKILFATLIFTGLRISEALALTWDDIDFEENLVHVRKGKTKNAKRSVMMIEGLRARLLAHRLGQEPGVERVFPVNYRQARYALTQTCKKAGIPKYSLHECRHTFASILIDQGEQVTFISKQLGHGDPSITLKVYAHLFDQQANIERARERLEANFGGMM